MVATDSQPITSSPLTSYTTVAPHISIGILAWNEEKAIEATLQSLFQQSIFAELARLNAQCEIICVTNGCTDRTPQIAARLFNDLAANHPFRHTFSCRVADLPERGKANAWDQFVHVLSAKTARFLFLMDGDILLYTSNALWNMYQALQEHPEAYIAVDRPLKDISFKARKSLFERLSLATTRMTQKDSAQLTGQLYCIRARIARNIYLPRDLPSVEDGFLKSVVCTDFLTRPSLPERIVQADDAAHVFEAYVTVPAIFRNQKRQMIGQTVNHLLVDDALKKLPLLERKNLAETLKQKDSADPLWLKNLIGEHVRRAKYFWRLFPGVVGFRFKRWAKLAWPERLTHFPAATVGLCMTLAACWAAHRSLKQGYANYWPEKTGANMAAAKTDAETVDRVSSHTQEARTH
ncbi:MAG: glycosyltransferase [Verrucomicrobiota bacterium]